MYLLDGLRGVFLVALSTARLEKDNPKLIYGLIA
jgi:hypothetical protein